MNNLTYKHSLKQFIEMLSIYYNISGIFSILQIIFVRTSISFILNSLDTSIVLLGIFKFKVFMLEFVTS